MGLFNFFKKKEENINEEVEINYDNKGKMIFARDLNCVGALKCLEDVSIDLC